MRVTGGSKSLGPTTPRHEGDRGVPGPITDAMTTWQYWRGWILILSVVVVLWVVTLVVLRDIAGSLRTLIDLIRQ